MQRIALDIDPIAFVRNSLGGNEPDPVSSVIMAELGGAESIVCYLRDDQMTVKQRDISLFKEIVKTHLTVRCNLTEEHVRNLIALKVDMITFVAPGDLNSFSPQPISLDTYSSQLQNYIAELRSNNILSSVLIEPTINEVKTAGRFEFDYVELDATSLSEASDMNSEVDALENLSSLALASSKLGMGVNISGGIGYDNIREVAQINFIEDIVVGKPVLSKAVFIGIEQALRDLQAIIS
ncbi:MAG: pyridoxine 5'-phosphate synthase [Calditrichaeota bacterium]|nr:MAG: pyridoxine 5'-phosphate synthase [Calditrichota bacterium]MBL1204216.1 pyridoxine 5'-phosphate synthase [Calditrichota bacterium]NOG44046.1 pyridoxine 5'-phosphate synthase [Calditrichota bacterium]